MNCDLMGFDSNKLVVLLDEDPLAVRLHVCLFSFIVSICLVSFIFVVSDVSNLSDLSISIIKVGGLISL